MIRRMMTISVADDLLRGADEACDLPNRHAVLKRPSDASVLEHMRRDLIAKVGKLACAIPTLAFLQYQSASVFDRTNHRHATPAL